MSQEGYGLFLKICDLYHVLFQVTIFLAVWDIFYRPERERKTLLPIGVFAAANVLLRLCPGVPGWVRYAASAAVVLGYCYLKYKRHLEKAVFTLLLFYNFHGMSFLASNSIYQFMMDSMLGRLDARDEGYMSRMYMDSDAVNACGLSYAKIYSEIEQRHENGQEQYYKADGTEDEIEWLDMQFEQEVEWQKSCARIAAWGQVFQGHIPEVPAKEIEELEDCLYQAKDAYMKLYRENKQDRNILTLQKGMFGSSRMYEMLNRLGNLRERME